MDWLLCLFLWSIKIDLQLLYALLFDIVFRKCLLSNERFIQSLFSYFYDNIFRVFPCCCFYLLVTFNLVEDPFGTLQLGLIFYLLIDKLFLWRFNDFWYVYTGERDRLWFLDRESFDWEGLFLLHYIKSDLNLGFSSFFLSYSGLSR